MKNILKNSYFILIKSGIKNREILTVLFSSFVTLLFEVFGFGIFIPIVNTIVNSLDEINFLIFSFQVQNYDKIYLIKILALIILIVFFLKSIVALINGHLIANFWIKVNNNLSIKIFKNILNMDLNEFNKNSNTTYSNIIVLEIEKFSELINSIITFILELFIVVSIIIILLIYDLKSSIFILVMMMFSGSIIYVLFKKRLVNWGLNRQFAQDMYQNDIKSGLLSHLSIKINGGNEFFIKNAFRSLSIRNFNIGRQKLYSGIPKNFIELSGLIMIISTGYFLYELQKQTLESSISFIIILIISFTRILPSFNKILTSYNQLQFSKSIVDLIKEYLIHLKNQSYKGKEVSKFNESIILENVKFNFPNSKIKIGPHTLNINKGELIGLFGKSGSGKSTLIKLIMGVLEPTSGKLTLDKLNYKDIHKKTFYNIFGYVEQNVRLFNASFIENIILSNNKDYDIFWFNRIIEICNLEEVKKLNHSKNILEDGINLSGGQIQRIGLARALYKKPDIIVLDEFTSALDLYNKESILKSLIKLKKELNMTIISISHDNYIKQYCDKVIKI